MCSPPTAVPPPTLARGSATSSVANLAHVAARARVMSSFAARGNLADCVRAGQTQGKLMSLLGTAAGAVVAWIIGPEPFNVVVVMMPLAVISCYSMHASSRLVVLRTLNVQRCERVYAALIVDLTQLSRGARQRPLLPNAPTSCRALSPEAVAEQEMFTLPYRSVLPGRLLLQPLFSAASALWNGGLLSNAANQDARRHLDAAWPLLEAARNRYGEDAAAANEGGSAVVVDGQFSSTMDGGTRLTSRWQAAWFDRYALAAVSRREEIDGSDPLVALWHVRNAQPADRLRAFWHASLVRHRLAMLPAASCDGGAETCPLIDVLHECAIVARLTWPHVERALGTAGWDMRTVFLEGSGGTLDVDRLELEQLRAATLSPSAIVMDDPS